MVSKVEPVTATDSQRSNANLWARFRFSVIVSLLSAPLARGELKVGIRSLAEKIWTHPVTGQDVQYAATTIERWYYKARNEQDDPVRVLQRAIRKDHGKVSLTPKLAEHLRRQYHDHSHWSYQLHYDNLASAVKADCSLGPLRSYSTVKRFMQTNGMVRMRRVQPAGPRNQSMGSREDTARLELKSWLLDIILSRATPSHLRNEIKIKNLDDITEVARNGPIDLRKRALAILARSKGSPESVVAECLNMSPATVSRAYIEFRHGDDPQQARRRRPRKKDHEARRRMINSLLEILTRPDPEYREKVELVLATLHSNP